MTNRFETRILIGLLLILAGILFLIDSILPGINLSPLFWAAVFGLGGLLFLGVFAGNRANWWALIPGFTLIGLSLTIVVGAYFPGQLAELGGAVFLGMIGLSFLAVYLLRREQWWAIIPGGVLLTLAFVAALSAFGLDQNGMAMGGIFFFGLGLTFGLVALLPTPQGHMAWAWIPAGILLVIGALMTVSQIELMKYIWPAALIVFGFALIMRSVSRSRLPH